MASPPQLFLDVMFRSLAIERTGCVVRMYM